MTNLIVLLFFISFYYPIRALVLNIDPDLNLEQKNKPRKHIWSRGEDLISQYKQRNYQSDLLFKTESIDTGYNVFDAFDTENIEQPITYVQREKRSLRRKRSNRIRTITPTKQINGEVTEVDLTTPSSYNNLKSSTPNMLIAYTTVVNKQHNVIHETLTTNSSYKYNNVRELNISKDELIKVKPLDASDISFNNIYLDLNNHKEIKNAYNVSELIRNLTNIKRRFIHSKNNIVNSMDYEPITKNASGSKVGRRIIDKDFSIWNNDDLSGNNRRNKYLDENHLIVVPKHQEFKPVSESGLIKVLAMLTKAFKQIMKQHDNINKTHGAIVDVAKEYKQHGLEINKKMHDFNVKYSNLMEYHEKLKNMEANINTKEYLFHKYQIIFSDNMSELQSQQKKFLTQQREFYNTQKNMLAQNEKINSKQAAITKVQDDISLRQTNLSQLFNNIKQSFMSSKHENISNYLENVSFKPESLEVTKQTSTTPELPNTESIKINLLTFPKYNKVFKQDQNMLTDKDFHTIDDIVYKYYFNNTFIDNLIKSRILNEFVDTFGSKNINEKRNDILKITDKSTILLPINETNVSGIRSSNVNRNKLSDYLIRNKRWLNHQTKRKNNIKTRRHVFFPKLKDSKSDKEETVYTTEKTENNTVIKENVIEDNGYNYNKNFVVLDKVISQTQTKGVIDPFIKMTTSFCNEIGQNSSKALKWCIEKTLRKLHIIGNNHMQSVMETSEMTKDNLKTKLNNNIRVKGDFTTELSKNLSEVTKPISKSQIINFPDNDELELNLKEFDLKPDEEGNIYFDGSMHASDLPDSGNEAMLDFMEDSNSRVQIDPLTLDLQARRRAYIHRYNENAEKLVPRKGQRTHE